MRRSRTAPGGASVAARRQEVRRERAAGRAAPAGAPLAAAPRLAGLHGSADGIGRSLAAARVRLHAARAPRAARRSRTPRPSASTSAGTRFVLVVPVLRTLAGIVALADAGCGSSRCSCSALLTAVWAVGRFRLGSAARRAPVAARCRRSALVVAGRRCRTVVDLRCCSWCGSSTTSPTGTSTGSWSPTGASTAATACVTQHSPSIALTAIAYLDASVPPLGRAVRLRHAEPGLGRPAGRAAVALRPRPGRRRRSRTASSSCAPRRCRSSRSSRSEGGRSPQVAVAPVAGELAVQVERLVRQRQHEDVVVVLGRAHHALRGQRAGRSLPARPAARGVEGGRPASEAPSAASS